MVKHTQKAAATGHLQPLVKIMRILPLSVLEQKSDEDMISYYRKLSQFQRLNRVESERLYKARHRVFLRKLREAACSCDAD